METIKLTSKQIRDLIKVALANSVTVSADKVSDLPSTEEMKEVAKELGVRLHISCSINDNDGTFSYCISFYDRLMHTLLYIWTTEIPATEDELAQLETGVVYTFRPKKLISVNGYTPSDSLKQFVKSVPMGEEESEE